MLTVIIIISFAVNLLANYAKCDTKSNFCDKFNETETVVNIGSKVYFLSANQYWVYDTENQTLRNRSSLMNSLNATINITQYLIAVTAVTDRPQYGLANNLLIALIGNSISNGASCGLSYAMYRLVDERKVVKIVADRELPAYWGLKTDGVFTANHTFGAFWPSMMRTGLHSHNGRFVYSPFGGFAFLERHHLFLLSYDNKFVVKAIDDSGQTDNYWTDVESRFDSVFAQSMFEMSDSVYVLNRKIFMNRWSNSFVELRLVSTNGSLRLDVIHNPKLPSLLDCAQPFTEERVYLISHIPITLFIIVGVIIAIIIASIIAIILILQVVKRVHRDRDKEKSFSEFTDESDSSVTSFGELTDEEGTVRTQDSE